MNFEKECKQTGLHFDAFRDGVQNMSKGIVRNNDLYIFIDI